MTAGRALSFPSRREIQGARPDQLGVPDQLRVRARAVRQIGDGWHDDPEAVAIAKDDVAKRLVAIARELDR